MTGAARIALLGGGSALALLAATQWLGGDLGAPDDVGRVEIRDVLVTRDAQVQTGSLEGCDASSCELNGRRIARDALSFIGLDAETPTPPPVEDPERDELHLRGGGVVHERLVRIDDEAVFVGARRLERGEVAWVYLAGERTQRDPQATSAPRPEPEGSDEIDQPPPPPPPEPESEPDPGQEPLPEPRDPPEEAFQGCPDDRPLGAWIWLRNDYQDFRPPNCRGSETQVVRFRLEADPGTQLTGSPVALAYTAREIRYSVSTDGCFDVDDGDYRTCNAEGTFAEGTLPLTVDNLGYAKFFPLEPQLGFQYPTPPTTPFELTVHCLHHPTGVESDNTVGGMNGISIAPGECAHPHRDCNDYCVAPTLCKDPTRAPQDCYLKPERFAVIPFEGALVDGPEREERGLCVIPGSSQIRWRVCCGCAETGPPPEFDPRPPADPCEDAAATFRGLVGRLRGLAEAYRSHEDSFRCAEAGRETARDRVFGVDGSLAAYSYHLPWVATSAPRAQGAGRATRVDDTARIVSDIVDLVQDVREGTRSILNVAQLLIDLAASTPEWKNAQDPLRAEYRAAQLAARDKARQYLARNPGDLKGATEVFDEEFRARAARISPRRGLNALGALRNLSAWGGLWQASKRLVRDVSLYIDWRAEEQRAKRDMESTQDAMQDVQAEIDLLRARCPDLPPGSGVPPRDPLPPHCPDVPPGSEHLRDPAAPAAERAIPGAPGASDVLDALNLEPPAAPSTPGAAGGAATSGGASPPGQGLDAAQQRLDTAVQRLGARMAGEVEPRLVLFLLDLTVDVEPEILLGMLEKAAQAIQALAPDLREAEAAAREIEQRVEAQRPPEAAAPGSR
jgi:hypothetical protein